MRLLLLTVLALLSACGGGGSGGGGQNSPAPPDQPAPPGEPPPPPDPARFTISGSVSASSNQAVDGDTNDPGNVLIPNDTLGSAQHLNNPITLGGYVNRPGTGAPGRSQSAGDVDDFFRVELLAGQAITVLVAEFERADADLFLYNTDGDVVDFSTEIGEVESLVAPEDGTYIVNVNAFDGATNYILTIGNQSGAARFSRQHYIEPWQAVVRYHDHGAMALTGNELSLEQLGGGPGRPGLMALRKVESGQRYLANRLGPALAKRSAFRDETLRARFETLMTIKALHRHAGVALAEPNYRVRSYFTPDDEAIPFQWHYPLIDLPAAWETTVGDSAVTVAVIDSGVLSGHPDLRDQLVAGYDFVRNPLSAGDGDGIDPIPEDLGNLRSPGPSAYHGTHVAGTVAAAGDNAIGVAGVAYGTRIMPLRVLGDGGAGTGYDVSQGIRYAAGLANDSGTLPSQPADVINLSLGGGPFSQAQQQLFEQVRSQGTIVVAAAGNEASTVPQYPASYEGVLSVSAVDINRQLAPYSSRGSSIDLAAPGGNNSTDFNGDGYPDGVLSTGGSGGPTPEFAYTFLNGTSMAAPHVAGVMALMRSVNPQLSPEDIDSLLSSGALTDDTGTPGRDDNYGHGIINAYKAVLAALEALGSDPADNPRLIASATTISFGSGELPVELTLGNAGKGELDITGIATSATWLSVTPLEVDNSGLGTYQVTIDRQGLEGGVYSADITVTSSANATRVKVFMSVGSPGGSADVGTVYVLLYDLLNDEVVAQASARAVDGRYSFQLSGIPAGDYELVAGSDADNDLFICDAGEACGAWLTLDQPITLTLDSDRQDLDFPIEYQVFLPELAPASKAAGVTIITSQRQRPGGYRMMDGRRSSR